MAASSLEVVVELEAVVDPSLAVGPSLVVAVAVPSQAVAIDPSLELAPVPSLELAAVPSSEVVGIVGDRQPSDHLVADMVCFVEAAVAEALAALGASAATFVAAVAACRPLWVVVH